jgi:hypothetical protein
MLLWGMVLIGDQIYGAHYYTVSTECQVFLNPEGGAAYSNRRVRRYIQNLSWRNDRHSGRGIQRYIKIQPDIRLDKYVVFL